MILQGELAFSLMVPIHIIYDVIFPEAFIKLWIMHYFFSHPLLKRGHWKECVNIAI